MKDKLNITIRIANLPPLPLTINRQEEEIIRIAEKDVNGLWNNWNERFDISPDKLMAMVAFQFAKTNAMRKHLLDQAAEELDRLDYELDKLLDLDNGTGK